MTHINNKNQSKFSEVKEESKLNTQSAVNRESIRLLLPHIKEELVWLAAQHFDLASEVRELNGNAKRDQLSILRLYETRLAKCIVAYELYAPIVGAWDTEINDLIAIFSKVIAKHWDE